MDTIYDICKQYGIENYTINDDGSIDVNDDVDLYNKDLTELPLSFNKVSGDFDCDKNLLTSLKGSPKWVGGYFSCGYNNLTSLVFSPEYVGDDFYCLNNKNLTNPKGCSEKIGGVFYCFNTPLSSIFNNVDQDFLYAFNFNRIIKDNTVNLKRLKYVMDLYDKLIDLEEIEKYYRIL